jgi:hypothetical protein
MTDQPNPAAPPPDDTTRTEPGPTWTKPSLPAVEPADEGAPAHAVARDGSPEGAAVAGSGPRRSGLRWAIALGGLAVVVAITVAILALASGKPTLSIAVGYMPNDTVQYGEYRLDLPGDQRQKLAAFLSKLPGFADQSAVQPKLYEVFDRIVAAASSNSQTFTADIEPWFGGQIATGSRAPGAALTGVAADGPSLAGASVPLVVITIKDQAKANAWVQKTIGAAAPGENVATTAYNGATLYSLHGLAVAVTDKVLLGGGETTVKAAIDSNGKGTLAQDPEFKAAFATVTRDYVGFSFMDYRAFVDSFVAMAAPSGALDSTTIDDALLPLIPAWISGDLRFEDDAIVGEGAFPSVDIGFAAKNRTSPLAGHVPPSTLYYGEFHDVGAVLKAFLAKLRAIPELTTGFSQIDQAAGLVGGIDGVTGWWGDMAIAIGTDADGQLTGGLLITPTDAAAAKRTFDTLKSFAVIGGAQAGVTLRDEQHGDTTVTVIDFSAATGASGGLPPGVKAEIAYAVTDQVVVIGYGASYVNAVLDAGPGPSLAEDARYKALLGRVGAENLGVSYLDVQGIRALVEPWAKSMVPADAWAQYEKEYRPYLEPLDAYISSSHSDGGLNRLPMAFTVK